MLTLAERLQTALRRKPGATASDLARAAGVSQPSVSEWLTGKTKTLKAESARKAAAYLGCRREWLETGLGDPGWATSAPLSTAHPGNLLQTRETGPAYVQTSVSTSTLIPVTGELEQGGTTEMTLRTDPAGEVLGHVDAFGASQRCFALRVQGDHLYPTVRHGACLIIEPEGDCITGELVALQMRNRLWLIGELVAIRDDSVIVLPAQGGQRRAINAGDILHTWPVVATVAASRFSPADRR